MDEKLNRLRLEAERVLEEGININTDIPQGDLNKIIHDLKVYQIELELQNEELRITQKRLEDSNYKFAQLYNEAPVGYVTLNQNSVILQANQTFANMVNKEHSQILNLSFSEFLNDEDRSIFLSRYNAFFKKPADKNMELKMARTRGKESYIRITGSLITEEGNELNNENRTQKLFLIVSDITELKNAELHLKERNKELECISKIRQEMHNDVSIAEFCIKVTEYLIPAMQFPEITQSFIELNGKVFSSGGNYGDIQNYLQADIKPDGKKQGSLIVNYTENKAFLIPHEQQLINNIAISIEIFVGKKLANEKLKESEEQYRLLFDAAREGIAVIQEGKIIYLNPMVPDFTGYDYEEHMNANFLEFIHPDDRDFVKTNYKMRISGGKSQQKYEFRILKKDKSIKWAEVSAVVLEWKGKPATLNFLIDINERKLAELELKKLNEKLQASKDEIERNLQQKNTLIAELTALKEQLEVTNASKDKFFSIISHDLRSPFNGFLNMTEIMANGLDDFSEEEISKIGKEMFRSASNIYKLIENLLDWARMQNGQIEFNPEELDLYKIINNSIEAIHHRADQKGIFIYNEISKDIKIRGDEKMIHSIIQNLLTNAVKFTNKGGMVIITSNLGHEGEWILSVKDTGIGISKSNIDKLFRLDEKVKSIGTDGEPSTGLGLMLCKEFVEKHGGKIWVESEEGKGSIFYLSLPCSV